MVGERYSACSLSGPYKARKWEKQILELRRTLAETVTLSIAVRVPIALGYRSSWKLRLRLTI